MHIYNHEQITYVWNILGITGIAAGESHALLKLLTAFGVADVMRNCAG